MKRTGVALLSTAILGMCALAPAIAEASAEPERMWECPQEDGVTLYTNKERAGCQVMTLKPLSVFPDLSTMRTRLGTKTDTPHPPDRMPSQEIVPQDTTHSYQTK
jgi:hypothetical protein